MRYEDFAQPDNINVEVERYEELKIKEELLEKFISRIEDVLNAYDDEDGDFKKDIEYELNNIKEELC